MITNALKSFVLPGGLVAVVLLCASLPVTASIYTSQANYIAAAPAGMAVVANDFEDWNTATGNGVFPNDGGNGKSTFDSGGFTYHGIKYVGSFLDHSVNPVYNLRTDPLRPLHPVLFPSDWETYIFQNPGFYYSVNGSAALVGGRLSLDITLPSGTTEFGASYGFDRGTGIDVGYGVQTPYGPPVDPNAPTIKITFFLQNGGQESIFTRADDLTPFDSNIPFIGYRGEEITHVQFLSLLPDLNPGFRIGNNNEPGYYSYFLIDDVLRDVSVVPEPASFLCWSSIAACVVAVRLWSNKSKKP